MIKKILITILLVFLIPNNSFAKAPPLGTGSLVPSNIMIMLDNSGSMAWDLGIWAFYLEVISRQMGYPLMAIFVITFFLYIYKKVFSYSY